MGNIVRKNEVYEEMREAFGQVPSFAKEVPESALGGFWSLMKGFQLAETKIPNKYKELIGIAVSGATRCKYCALFHTEAAKLFGATDDEIAEASLMAGWTMCASTFLNAQQTDYETFAKETVAIVDHVKRQAAKAPAKPVPERPVHA